MGESTPHTDWVVRPEVVAVGVWVTGGEVVWSIEERKDVADTVEILVAEGMCGGTGDSAIKSGLDLNLVDIM